MEYYDKFPKNVKKTVRYIKQDISYEQLVLLKQILKKAIAQREKNIIRKK